ncbi:hypothetical protein CU098_010879 [Rhizopus stolonifer]|uniref:Uncharacterized protein n=1 Tax=Rhizopus stolonifer TaxID=4846 RepID=A0A367JQ69_RHIST|nr:hypothetical protein CU098_010879 [Rhizopus stolonifer]
MAHLNLFKFFIVLAFLTLIVSSAHIDYRKRALWDTKSNPTLVRPGVMLRIETAVEEHTVFTKEEVFVTAKDAKVETAVETKVVTVASGNDVAVQTASSFVTEFESAEAVTEYVTVVEVETALVTEMATVTLSASASSASA